MARIVTTLTLLIIFFILGVTHAQTFQETGWGPCKDLEKMNTFSRDLLSADTIARARAGMGPRSAQNSIETATYVWKVDCKKQNVTVNWEDPSDLRTFPSLVKRAAKKLNGTMRTNSKALWVLDGGPGWEGLSYANQFNNFLNFLNQEYDILILSQRGTGYSRLSPACLTNIIPSVDAIVDCLKKNNDTLKHLSVTASAKDLQYWIKSENYSENAAIAIEYGTVLLKRFMQLYPTTLSWAVFDGVRTKDFPYADRVQLALEGTQNMVEQCKLNAACSRIFQKYGGLDNVLKNYHNQTNICAKQVITDMEQFKVDLYQMFRTVSDLKKLILPAILRIMRCGKRDVAWLQNLETKWKYNAGIKSKSNSTTPNTMFGGELHWAEMSSLVLGANQTEISPKKCGDNWICTGTEYKHLNVSRALRDYLAPETSLVLPINSNATTIVLGLNGDLDAYSPLPSVVGWENDFSSSRTLFVPVRGGEPHVIFNLWNPYQNYRAVGFEILREFMTQATKSSFNVTATKMNIENLIKENINYNFMDRKGQIYEPELDIYGGKEILPLYDENYDPTIDDNIIPASGSQKKNLAFFTLLR